MSLFSAVMTYVCASFLAFIWSMSLSLAFQCMTLIKGFGLSAVFRTASVNSFDRSSMGPISSMAIMSWSFIAFVMALTPIWFRSLKFTTYFPIFGPFCWCMCASQPVWPESMSRI